MKNNMKLLQLTTLVILFLAFSGCATNTNTVQLKTGEIFSKKAYFDYNNTFGLIDGKLMHGIILSSDNLNESQILGIKASNDCIYLGQANPSFSSERVDVRLIKKLCGFTESSITGYLIDKEDSIYGLNSNAIYKEKITLQVAPFKDVVLVITDTENKPIFKSMEAAQ